MRGYVTDPTADRGLRLADDLSEPQPAENEVVIEVRAYSVNRGELRLLQMRPEDWRPGQDLTGVVASEAADGSGPPVGTRVVAIAEAAGWSERIALPTNVVAELPDEVSFEQAAALPIAGLTALRALRLGGSVLGRDVLVTGATGGVGQFAVQLSVASGARVTAQVSAAERGELARSLGAHRAVTDLDDVATRFALVLDGVGGPVLEGAIGCLAPEGTVATYGNLQGTAQVSMRDFREAPLGRVVGFFHAHPQHTRGADLAILAGLVGDGRLEPVLGAIRDWSQTREVIEELGDRQLRGKAVLTVS